MYLDRGYYCARRSIVGSISVVCQFSQNCSVLIHLSFSCSRKLQPLIDYVLMLGKTLEKKYASGQPETSELARRLKKMLVDLNEYDEARAILRTFNLREAL